MAAAMIASLFRVTGWPVVTGFVLGALEVVIGTVLLVTL